MQSSEVFDEQDVLRRVREKDETAFVLLLNAHMPMIRQETARFRNVAIDEDDLAQEAALGLLSAAQTYRSDGGASFATYARVCISRRLINAVRRIPREEIPHESPLDIGDRTAEDVTLSPDEVIQEMEQEEALMSELKKLLSPLEYRVLIWHMASYSYKEIAQMLHMQAKSVDNAVQRIRRKLKKAL